MRTRHLTVHPMLSGPTIRRVRSLVGVTLLSAGLTFLGMLAWSLWGTSITTTRAQEQLEQSFAEEMERATSPGAHSTNDPEPSTPLETATSSTALVGARPQIGEPVLRLSIPAIALEKVVVMGTTTESLKRGPGLFRTAELPGEVGNVTIAGHRTTYGAPFRELDELAAGDEVIVTSAVTGTHTYEVVETLIIKPSQREVLDDVPTESWLTLVSCHPEHSTRQRIVVRAKLRTS